MAAGDPVLYSLYVYAPNKIAPIVFTVLYGLSAVFHLWQCWHYRAFSLVGLQVLAAFLFTLGYGLREYGAYHYIYDPDDSTSLIIFILSQVFIYVAPPLLELSNYHVLGRLFHYVPYCAPVPADKILLVFGIVMGIVEVLNGLGVSLASNTSSTASTQEMGNDLSLAAISIQIGALVIFAIIAAIFNWRCAQTKGIFKSISPVLLTLYASTVLILIRCAFRIVERVGNSSIDISDLDAMRQLSPVLRYETYFLAFESSVMLVNSALWNVVNPARFLPREKNFYLTPDGVQVEGEKVVDTRTVSERIVNMLTFGILYRHKNGPQIATHVEEHPLQSSSDGPGQTERVFV